MSDAVFLAAHRAGDHATLARLYAQSADLHEAAGDLDAACFYLTQAYVFALIAGDARAQELNRRLAARGRDTLWETTS